MLTAGIPTRATMAGIGLFLVLSVANIFNLSKATLVKFGALDWIADAVADAMTTALGKHGVTVSADSGDAEAPMDVEPELDAEPAPEAPEDAMVAEETTTETTETEEETLEEETPKDDALTQLEAVANELEKKEEVVQEVARRVVKRLLNTIQK